MADFMAHLKNAAWTELEVGAVVVGGVAATKWLSAKKVFKDEFSKNPQWFDGDRPGAPFKIKWWGGIKAGGAIVASTYVTNPWFKLILMGIAVQGTVEQLRVLTYNVKKQSYKIDEIGANANQAEIDRQLAEQAEKYRAMMSVDGPEFMGDAGDRYETNVAGPDFVGDAGDRYKTMVAMKKNGMLFDEDDDDMIGFGFESDDGTRAA
jgi:hypothetical protein